MMTTSDLVYMMFENEPIEMFEKIMEVENTEFQWDQLLDMCYTEKIYESVGGDYGDEDNPPINYDRIEYLNKLIDFLEQSGVKTEK